MLIVKVIQGQVQVSWQLRNTVYEINVALNQCAQVKIRHIYWEANMAADWLSKYGHSIPINLLLSECETAEFRNIIQEDWVERILVRRGT